MRTILSVLIFKKESTYIVYQLAEKVKFCDVELKVPKKSFEPQVQSSFFYTGYFLRPTFIPIFFLYYLCFKQISRSNIAYPKASNPTIPPQKNSSGAYVVKAG